MKFPKPRISLIKITFVAYVCYLAYFASTMPAEPATWLNITVGLGFFLLALVIYSIVPKRP